jgi:hypothetical protein
MTKITHKITITMFLRESKTLAKQTANNVSRLLNNSKYQHEYVIEDISEPKPPAASVGDITNQGFRSAMGITALTEVTDWREPEAEGPQKLTPEQVNALIRNDRENSAPTLYMMTSGASLYYGLAPFTGKLDIFARITVSQMFPHYSNPAACADDLESLFKKLGHQVIRSVYIESKVD